jgi:hypothetical protein
MALSLRQKKSEFLLFKFEERYFKMIVYPIKTIPINMEAFGFKMFLTSRNPAIELNTDSVITVGTLM